ncbi:D-2-hydroxyacid dehydrogenase [Hazenella coriacea]|uniref:Phosphoglycerate dehydrogenase-like enzyme n=1 Tax=Hazenella coriacea TaxID=1179467 RepID=A0A4R3L280_9BACL|nr:D-2-hydroxyacid dehydrogenase [Hazenella coriacea]TCS92848.1 phosphoglycerate dehydrogenase-like enzyme [Hazenella coriacea]
MVHVVSTAKMSEKHQLLCKETFPGIRFSFFNEISEARGALPEAEVLITYGEDLTDEVIDKCTKLRWIQVISAGLECMPFQALQKKNIHVTNARGIHAIPMAEYVMAVLLQITRCTIPLMDRQRARHWDRSIRTGELAGKQIGIIGAGAIGQAIAERAKAFQMKTIGCNTDGHVRPNFDQMVQTQQVDELLTYSDFVVVTVPLTPETHHWIDEQKLNMMKPSAYLIHIARGAVVQESALLHLLQQEKIAGAVIDVFEQEPLPPEHPFWDLPNVILTPHLSGRSPLYMTRAMEIFIHNMKVYQNQIGNWINPIDLSKGY